MPEWKCILSDRRKCLDPALLYRDQIPLVVTDVDLARTRNLLLGVEQHLLPLGQPPDRPRNGEQHREHLGLESHGLVNDSGIEVHIGVELPLDEVFVLQRDPFEFDGNVELGIPPVTLNTSSAVRLMILARGS